MGSPTISIYLSAIRPQLWKRMYNSLLTNDVSFEIIFIGNVSPTCVLPENCYYIYSPVKPPQCAEIGLRVCEGEYCILAMDDLIFNEHALDNLLKAFEDTKREDIVVSCTPYLYGKELPNHYYRFWPCGEEGIGKQKLDSPLTPIAGLYKTKIVKELGGIDRGFIKSHWDVDLAMRLFSAGGIGFFCNNATAEEILDPTSNKRLCTRATADREYLHLLWTIPMHKYLNNPSAYKIMYLDESKLPILQHRTKPVDRFVDENILALSQGPNGTWI